MIIGTGQYIADAISDYKQLPLSYQLEQNYPNPYNPNTTIEYSLPQASNVTINLYNILGQRIKQLMTGLRKEAGYHQIEWDASRISSGIYYYRIEAGEFQDVKKMILLR